MRRRPGTLAGLVVARVGWVDSMRVFRLLGFWVAYAERSGRPGGVDEVRRAFESVRKAQFYRDLALFRKAFPEFETPTEFWERAKSAELIGDELPGELELLEWPLGPLGLAA